MAIEGHGCPLDLSGLSGHPSKVRRQVRNGEGPLPGRRPEGSWRSQGREPHPATQEPGKGLQSGRVAQGKSRNGRTQTGQNRSCRAPAPSEATVNTQVPAQCWAKLVQPRPKSRVGRPERRWGTGLTLSNVAATCYIWLLKLTEIK